MNSLLWRVRVPIIGILVSTLLVVAAILFWPTAYASELRAVSLATLQTELQRPSSRQADVRRLCGLTTIFGFLNDEKNNDFILFGAAQQNSTNALLLDDFVVALRNAWLKYAELSGNTYYYSYPGCSIDPNPVTTERLDRIAARIRTTDNPLVVQQFLQEWDATCKEPQNVRVLGIPFDSSFAQLIVRADYDLKRLVDGSDAIRVDGFLSLRDRRLNIVRAAIAQGGPVEVSLSNMNRFWFLPGTNQFEQVEGSVWVKESPVLLLTEETAMNRKGGYVATGGTDTLAQAFAHDFSKLFDSIAFVRPIYAQMQNIFRFVAMAQVAHEKQRESADARLDYLLNGYEVSEQRMQRNVPGRSAVAQLSGANYHFWMPSCGGVDIRLDLADAEFSGASEIFQSVRDRILRERPSSKALVWNIKLNEAEEAAFFRRGTRVQYSSLRRKSPGDVSRSEREVQSDEPSNVPDWVADLGGLYRNILADKEGNAVSHSLINKKLGQYKIAAVYRSYTDSRAFKLVDSDGATSIVKVRKLSKDAEKEANLNVFLLQQLKAKGLSVVQALPVFGSVPVAVHHNLIFTRESLAPGVPLSLVNKTDTLARYAEAAFDVFRKGNIPENREVKEAVRTERLMREKLLERNRVAENLSKVLQSVPAQQSRRKGLAADAADGFHQAFESVVKALFPGERRFLNVGLVHDNIAANFFADEKQVTTFDFGSDYVGNAGNVCSEVVRTLFWQRETSHDYENFKRVVEEVLSLYSKRKGEALSLAERNEILRCMIMTPYFHSSSNTKQILRELKATFYAEDAPDSVVFARLQPGEHGDWLSGKLNETEDAYRQHMEQLRMTIQMLIESSTEERTRQALLRLRELLNKILDARLRVVMHVTGDSLG